MCFARFIQNLISRNERFKIGRGKGGSLGPHANEGSGLIGVDIKALSLSMLASSLVLL